MKTTLKNFIEWMNGSDYKMVHEFMATEPLINGEFIDDDNYDEIEKYITEHMNDDVDVISTENDNYFENVITLPNGDEIEVFTTNLYKID